MTLDLEELIVADLDRAVAGIRPPSVDLTAVRRVAGRERRRLRAAAGAAVAAVVALGLGIGVGPWSGGRGVDTAAPVGADSLGVPWVDADDTVHLPSGVQVDVAGASGVYSRGGTTVAVIGAEIVAVEPDGSRSTIADGGADDVRPVVSADGRWVAWMGAQTSQFAGVRRTEIGSDTTTTIGVDRPSGIMDVGNDGSVLMATAVDEPLRWIPGDPGDGSGLDLGPIPLGPIPVSGADLPTSGLLLPDGFLVVYGAGQRVMLHAIGPTGRLDQGVELPVGYASFADDFSAYVSRVGDGLGVQQVDGDLRPTTSAPLDLPVGDRWVPGGWSRAGEVVIVDEATMGRDSPPRVEVCERSGTCRTFEQPSLRYVATS